MKYIFFTLSLICIVSTYPMKHDIDAGTSPKNTEAGFTTWIPLIRASSAPSNINGSIKDLPARTTLAHNLSVLIANHIFSGGPEEELVRHADFTQNFNIIFTLPCGPLSVSIVVKENAPRLKQYSKNQLTNLHTQVCVYLNSYNSIREDNSNSH